MISLNIGTTYYSSLYLQIICGRWHYWHQLLISVSLIWSCDFAVLSIKLQLSPFILDLAKLIILDNKMRRRWFVHVSMPIKMCVSACPLVHLASWKELCQAVTLHPQLEPKNKYTGRGPSAKSVVWSKPRQVCGLKNCCSAKPKQINQSLLDLKTYEL